MSELASMKTYEDEVGKTLDDLALDLGELLTSSFVPMY